ncbi:MULTISPECIES: DUF4174 domain-containing protein [Pseudomonas]|jgi:hypothetical protein|uniref:Tyrosyl-trna synthetase n=1 Tax=Pseudomonas putida TaxID=303 RepID=A0A379KS33_PSEPU|nr:MULTISPECIES: DUF4174 domain-containing protein [Pseudomonas]QPN47262.1 DUF4174 domain-containing protein [Priestia aryabhattai]MBG6123673.1 hypothetical protein [Pseudomonas sp. M2]MBM7395437.1 hypothetical protein [Pseudomonas sp. M5]NSX20245.1 DUF4174 domain-containing protein [Pseudomonas putida]RRV48954.1 DUF4174 domain-containing protein [Pseudomonas sp. p106]
MLVRSLTLATLLAVTGPLFAADSDAPLAKELGKARPLVIIAPSSADPTLRGLNDALKDPATQAAFKERGLVIYSVANMMGKREDKNLEQQTTMALIRELKLGASKGTKVILVGKDGERHMLKDDETGEKIDPQAIIKAVDELPASEKAVTAPEPVAAAAEPKAKDSKPAKPAKPAAPPKPLED